MKMTFRDAVNTLELNRPFAYSELQDAVDMAIEALKRQIPTKQGDIENDTNHFQLSKDGFLRCRVTNKDIRYPLISLEDLDCCPRCGQALKWG